MVSKRCVGLKLKLKLKSYFTNQYNLVHENNLIYSISSVETGLKD